MTAQTLAGGVTGHTRGSRPPADATLPADVIDAIVEALASALIADFRRNPIATVGSRRGDDRAACDPLSASGRLR